MNLKTTFVLLAVVAGAAAVWWLTPALPSWVGLTPPAPDAIGAGTQDVLKDKIVAAELSRIEIAPRGSDHPVLLERGPGGAWTAPGQWPARKPEVEQLVALLT